MSVKSKTSIISKRLKDYRVEAGLSQQALSDYAGVDRKTVNRIENGHFSPNIETLLRLTTALDVTPAEVFKGI
jgi:transcriptional regulator with XRE-family HTH domain